MKNTLLSVAVHASCWGGGAARSTEDIDLVVVQGHVSAARRLLRASPNFEVEPRPNCTKCTADGNNVEIQILAAPTLFKERFDETTQVVTLGNVKALKPALILNSKC